MLGYFDEDGSPMISVSVSGRRTGITIDAIIDTGFSSALSIPISVAIPLGLELTTTGEYELADGTIKRQMMFGATIRLGEEFFETDILLNESDIALIGSELLKDKVLVVDYGNDTVEIRSSEPMCSPAPQS